MFFFYFLEINLLVFNEMILLTVKWSQVDWGDVEESCLSNVVNWNIEENIKWSQVNWGDVEESRLNKVENWNIVAKIKWSQVEGGDVEESRLNNVENWNIVAKIMWSQVEGDNVEESHFANVENWNIKKVKWSQGWGYCWIFSTLQHCKLKLKIRIKTGHVGQLISMYVALQTSEATLSQKPRAISFPGKRYNHQNHNRK